jgi:hypothetical protein
MTLAASANTEEQLLLWSAGTAARRDAQHERAAALSEVVDWWRLTELLRARRLLPTLGPRIVALAGERGDEQFAGAVAGSVEAGRRHGAFLQLMSERAIRALAQAGIGCSALKGPTLCETLYGDLGRRPAGDIDLLVAAEQIGEAVEVVRELGYSAPADPVDRGGLPLLHFALRHKDGTRFPPVELHWRVHWYERRFARERLLAPRDAAENWRPAPVDELTALLLFYARDGFISLRHATDIAAWWDAFGVNLAPGALERQAEDYPALRAAVLTAARVAQKTVGLPVKPTAGFARLGIRGALAVRLADPYPHSSEVQLYADMGLIDGLLTPRGGLGAFVRRQLAPPEAASGHLNEGWHRRFAFGRALARLARYGVTLKRLMRAPQSTRAA